MLSEAHPRLRGEHDSWYRKIEQGYGSSPLTRGAPRTMVLQHRGGGLIPAYAGSTIPLLF